MSDSGFFSASNQNARIRLFCFPHAGGGSAGFYQWKRILGHETEVFPVHLPGRENRLKVAQASTDAWKIFYKKFYKKKYPFFVTGIVLAGMSLLGSLRIMKYKKSK